MSLAWHCAESIRKVGGTARLVRANGTVSTFPASVQPRRSAGELDGSPLGVGAASYATLYAALDRVEELAFGDLVEYAGRRYRVQRSEEFLLEGKPVYRWAVLRRETGDGEGGGPDE